MKMRMSNHLCEDRHFNFAALTDTRNKDKLVNLTLMAFTCSLF